MEKSSPLSTPLSTALSTPLSTPLSTCAFILLRSSSPALKSNSYPTIRLKAMPGQPTPENRRIRYLTKLVNTGRNLRSGEQLSQAVIAKLKKELADLELQRDQGIQTRRHVSVEADRVIASTETAVRQGTATLERRFDRLEANLASRSSGRDELLERLLGQPGSSKEIQAEIDARKEDLKRKRREEREEEKQAEKRRKLEQLLEIPLEEGDTLQDGVVLRGDLGRRKMRGLRLPLRQAPLLPRGNRRDGHAPAGSLER